MAVRSPPFIWKKRNQFQYYIRRNGCISSTTFSKYSSPRVPFLQVWMYVSLHKIKLLYLKQKAPKCFLWLSFSTETYSLYSVSLIQILKAFYPKAHGFLNSIRIKYLLCSDWSVVLDTLIGLPLMTGGLKPRQHALLNVRPLWIRLNTRSLKMHNLLRKIC